MKPTLFSGLIYCITHTPYTYDQNRNIILNLNLNLNDVD